jgi:hypothetical protein
MFAALRFISVYCTVYISRMCVNMADPTQFSGVGGSYTVHVYILYDRMVKSQQGRNEINFLC